MSEQAQTVLHKGYSVLTEALLQISFSVGDVRDSRMETLTS